MAGLAVLSVAGTTFWTVVAAGAGAVLAGAVTGVVTFKVTPRQVTSAEGLADKQRAHERGLAEDERHQQRLLDAYTSVMRYVYASSAAMEWQLRSMRVVLDPPDQPPLPDPIDPTSQAIASLVASGEVGGLLRDFN